MKIKFATVPVGSKFPGLPRGTVFMKIKEVNVELLFERKPTTWRRNVVLVEGPLKGELGFFSDNIEIELVS